MPTTADVKPSIWSSLAAPLDAGTISWRQDGKASARDGRFFARFVPYIEANTVRSRLDAVVPGEWELAIDPLPVGAVATRDGVVDAETQCAFKARLSILGVSREDVGHGKDWKQAATDAFKRVAVRFGIGAELYDYEMNYVEVDGDGKYPKPVEDPAAAYARRHGRGAPSAAERVADARPADTGSSTGSKAGPAQAATPAASGKANGGITKMPFGKHKGKALTDVPDSDLRSTVDWCREKGKNDLADACEAELARRNGGEMFGDEEQSAPDDDSLPL